MTRMALSDVYTTATRITIKLLKQCSQQPSEEIEYLDISQRGITAIECLDTCVRLRSLVLCNNAIGAIRNVEVCRHLWSIDLTGNRVKSVDGICRFPAFGTLELGFNELEWSALERLSHMTILNLTLTGNTAMESDPNYRRHVIDLLPNLWMLDRKLITANERQQVARFFESSQFSSQPVRRKGNSNMFVPSSHKNLTVNGVFGDKTAQLMLKFPVSYIHNVEMDRRRLLHLTAAFDEDLALHSGSTTTWLTKMMEGRHQATQQCNMALLLLVAYHEYGLPLEVMQATLETAKLASICDISTIELFKLPEQVALQVMSLLFSAASVDRQEKQDGGLYMKLYESLSLAVDDLNTKVTSCKAKRDTKNKKVNSMKDSRTTPLQSLLPCEAIHLLCLVPQFFQSIETSKGTQQIIMAATRSSRILDNIGCIRWKVEARGGDTCEVYHDIASYLLQAASENMAPKGTRPPDSMCNGLTSDYIKTPILQHTSSVQLSAQRSHSAGSLKAVRPLASAGSHGNNKIGVGDVVMIPPESYSRIVALPQSDIAVLQKISTHTSTASSEPYFYADTRSLIWDRAGYWVQYGPTSTTVQSSSSQPCELHPPSPESPRSPDLPSRPCSQLTITSEDLHHVPSDESLLEQDASPTHVLHPPPMKVDIRHSIRSLVCDHLVAQEELDQTKGSLHKRTLGHTSTQEMVTTFTREGAQEAEPKGAPGRPPSCPPGGSLILSAPRVQLQDMWDCSRSCPASNTRAHSCHHQSAVRHTRATDPPLAPTPPTSPAHQALPPSTSTTSLQPLPHDGSPTRAGRPVVYQAWTVVNPSVLARDTFTTSARKLMTKRQPNSRPAIRRHSAPSKPSSSSEDKGPPPTTTVILQQRKPSSHPPPVSRPITPGPPPPTRQGQYPSEGVRPSSRASGTRKLGQTRSLLVGGTSVF